MERNERPQRMLARMAELFDLPRRRSYRRCGQNLTLRSMTDSEVRIFGKIDAVEYVR